MKYIVEHKLTKKPVRYPVAPYEIIKFDNIGAAELFVEVKTKIMGANFYNIVGVKK